MGPGPRLWLVSRNRNATSETIRCSEDSLYNYYNPSLHGLISWAPDWNVSSERLELHSVFRTLIFKTIPFIKCLSFGRECIDSVAVGTIGTIVT